MEVSPNHDVAARIYGPLDASKKEHRLIRFVGGRRELAWELGTFSLLADMEFTALSYCWGKPQNYRPVTVNGHEFQVRPSLYSFLVQMASENRRDWFFADAVCINQDNVSERSTQVTYMGEIYRKAVEVIAWIYHEDTDDPKVMKQLDIEKAVRDLQMKEKRLAAEGTELKPVEREVLTSLTSMARQRAASSDYWSRLWIVQEILLARRLTIRWYSFTFDWDDIRTLHIDGSDIPSIQLNEHGRPLKPHPLMTMREAGLFQYNHLPNSAENSIMCKQLWHWQHSAGRDLHAGKLLSFDEAVQFFSAQLCQIAHDNVFALFGIAECSIDPDYNMPMMELYTSALYNYMLCLWSRRPSPAPRWDSTKLESWNILNSLGLVYTKLAPLGQALMHAFQLDPFDEIVFLVSYLVCQRFNATAASLAQQRLAWDWLLFTKYTNFDVRRTDDLLKRRWYESDDMALNRFHNDLLDRFHKALDRQKKYQGADKELTAPTHQQLEAPANDGRVMRYSAWVHTTIEVCDKIWERWSSQQSILPSVNASTA
ncbi:hypothetical protein HII31_06822 [Pseudocercospora fuligena]|uniref:Heterokaryon incompatibility domain-containing protein n=1 Tax=Pseudocercospora fuligena TaxID=685502 RepID=A0A8H6RJ33_9PEZI|nr:hypothetical protein HII31_06822 [Pseudocercospora fuligena]